MVRLLKWPALLITVLLAAGAVAGQDTPLPPLSWTCPMHPEIVDDAKGTCPICKMDLVAVRLDSKFSCPVHSIVTEAKAGKCPICRRDLVQVTVAVSWNCPDKPEVEHLEPGKCADGRPRAVAYKVRAHGNHNPQHGGLFFMAGDNWHHLEGTYPEPGLFRLYLYDDFSRPLAADKAGQVTGRVVTEETFDSTTKTTREITAVPLTPAPGARYLEARIFAPPPPVQMVAKVKFADGGPEYRFDFSFPAFTTETTLDATALVASGVDASQIPLEVPDTAAQVMEQLRVRSDQIKTIIDKGAFADLYIPALQAKDLALALDLHARTLPAAQRDRAVEIIKRVVLAAWRLDSVGDQGDSRQIGEVYSAFSRAVEQLEPLFMARSRR